MVARAEATTLLAWPAPESVHPALLELAAHPERAQALEPSAAAGSLAALASLQSALAILQGVLLARVVAQPMAASRQAAHVWLTPDEAGKIANVEPPRIYAWARGKKWASRPSKRCLRIAEEPFRQWLATRNQ